MDPSGISSHAILKTENYWHICHQDLCLQGKEEHVIHLDTLHNTVTIYRGKYTNGLQSEKCVRHQSRYYNRYCETCEVAVCEACSEHISAVAAVYHQGQRGDWYASSALYVQDNFAKESKSKVGNTEQTCSLLPKTVLPVLKKNVFEIIYLLIYKSPIPFTAKENTCKIMLSNSCYSPGYHVYIF